VETVIRGIEGLKALGSVEGNGRKQKGGLSDERPALI
jgi:hypothetical protein